MGLLCSCGAPPQAIKSRAPFSAPRSGTQTTPLQVACTPTAPESCYNATDDNCNGMIDEGCGLPLGPLQVALAWSDADADLELIVADPNLEAASVGRFLASGLTKDRDCPGEGAACKGMNVETVTLPEGEPLRGSYSIRVSLERLGRSGDPVKARLGFHIGFNRGAYELRLLRVGEVAVFRADI